jgi:hypothetical protein
MAKTQAEDSNISRVSDRSDIFSFKEFRRSLDEALRLYSPVVYGEKVIKTVPATPAGAMGIRPLPHYARSGIEWDSIYMPAGTRNYYHLGYELQTYLIDDKDSKHSGRTVDSFIVKPIGTSSVIQRMNDVWDEAEKGWYLTIQHPINVIRNFCDQRYIDSCIDYYINTGILVLETDRQVAFLEPGAFKLYSND